jgi:hypothetical protein
MLGSASSSSARLCSNQPARFEGDGFVGHPLHVLLDRDRSRRGIEPRRLSLQPRVRAGHFRLPQPLEADMGITRIERAIDDIDALSEDAECPCEDIRLAWLNDELDAGRRDGSDFDALWTDR